MNAKYVLRIATPFAVGAIILLAVRRQPPAVETVELPSSEEPVRTVGDTQAAIDAAIQTGAPGYERGSATARVTVLELSDFGCPYCGKFHRETYPAIAKEFVDGGNVRWKYVPFVLGIFPNGYEAARAAECAAEQGAAYFWQMQDILFEQQKEWKSASDPFATFTGYARRATANEAAFKKCYQGESANKRVAASNNLADNLGVRVTPTFFINGARIEGAPPAAEFRALLQQALQSAQ